MTTPFRTRAAAFAALCVAPMVLHAQQIAAGHDERIARIEQSLLAAVQIEGRPPVEYPITDRMAFHHVPGVSVAVIDGGQIVFAKGYGVRDVETGEPVTTETLREKMNNQY